jgi:hypothetical protein
MEAPGSLTPDTAQCPFCDGTDTRLFSAFGSQLSVSTYWCNHCHTAFEKLKSLRKER